MKPGDATPQPFVPWKQFVAAKQQAQKLANQGNVAHALTSVEAFVRKNAKAHDNSLGGFGMLAGMVGKLIRGLDDEKAQGQQFLRMYTEFPEAPTYAVTGATGYVNHLLWKQKDPAAAEKFAREVLEAYGENLPATYQGAMLPVCLARALQRQGKVDEALELALAAPFLCPQILENEGLHAVLFECAKSKRDWDGMLGAARLAFALCDYAEEKIGKATELCVQACTAKGGPGLASQFVKSQESAETDSPFRDIPLPGFDPKGRVAQVSEPVNAVPSPAHPVTPSPAPALLAAAGTNLHARVNAQLALGDYEGALADALDFMREATAKDQMTKSLIDVARCFKAKDLNLLRANRFLEYQKTGQGENPLPGF